MTVLSNFRICFTLFDILLDDGGQGALYNSVGIAHLGRMGALPSKYVTYLNCSYYDLSLS